MTDEIYVVVTKRFGKRNRLVLAKRYHLTGQADFEFLKECLIMIFGPDITVKAYQNTKKEV